MAKKSEKRKPAPQSERGKGGHKATYATDKRSGGYLIRIVGPHCDKFAGREVPVTTKSGEKHSEKLQRLIWTGADKETGERVALYRFESKPREKSDASDVQF